MHGGLDMVDLQTSQSLKVKWITLYSNEIVSGWNFFFDRALLNYGRHFLFKCNFAPKDIIEIDNTFIREVCKCWSSFTHTLPVEKFSNEIIFNNSFVKINKKLVYFDKFVKSKASYVKDYFDEHGKPRVYNVFCRKYGIHNFPFTLYYGIIDAIPRGWKDSCRGDGDDNLETNASQCELFFLKFITLHKGNRLFYSSAISKKTQSPSCFRKRQAEFSSETLSWPRMDNFSLCELGC